MSTADVGAITLVDMHASWCIQVQTMKKTGEKSILSHSVTVSQIAAYKSVTVSPIIVYVCDLCSYVARRAMCSYCILHTSVVQSRGCK